jgi:hypothetical protein
MHQYKYGVLNQRDQKAKDCHMAYKMKLNTPYKGMTFIWNISDKVGVMGDDLNANNRDDIELFQRLAIAKNKYPSEGKRAPSIPALTNANGEMDLQTAFEVYWSGDRNSPLADGEVVSPAKNGQVYYQSGKLWTICYMNWKLFSLSKENWENLPNTCSAPLKIALTTKTTP